MRFCPTCRRWFAGDTPPYAVVHQYPADVHFHPVTCEPLEPAPAEAVVSEASEILTYALLLNDPALAKEARMMTDPRSKRW